TVLVVAGTAGYVLVGWYHNTVSSACARPSEEMRPMVDQILPDLQQQSPTRAEVERAKRNIIANQLRSVETIGGFGGRADLLNHYETFLGDPGYLPHDIARYRAVTPPSAQDFGRKFLFPSDHIELDVIPAPKRTASAEGGKQ